MGEPEISYFLNARAGVVKKEQQGAVTVGAATPFRQLGKQRADLITIKEPRLFERRTLGRNRSHPLSDRHHLGDPGGQVVEEAMKCGDTLITGTNLIVPLALEV